MCARLPGKGEIRGALWDAASRGGWGHAVGLAWILQQEEPLLGSDRFPVATLAVSTEVTNPKSCPRS